MAWPFRFVVGKAFGVVFLLGSATVAAFWWYKQRQLKNKILTLKRSKVEKYCSNDSKMPNKVLNITRFMRLDPVTAESETFRHMKIVSLADYVSTLSIPSGFNWRLAVRTILVRMRLNILLPFTALGPDDGAPQDPFAAVGGAHMVYMMLRDALSMLHLFSLGELMNLTSSGAQGSVDDVAMTSYLHGASPASLPEQLRELPNPFVIDTHLPKLLETHDPDAKVAHVEDPGGMDWLPDISLANVGQPYLVNDHQNLTGQTFAVLLNRLSVNLLPEKWFPPEWQGYTFKVQLKEGGPVITTPGQLVKGLQDDLGAEVYTQIVSRTTGFGYGMSLKQDNESFQIPVVVPVRTGISLLSGEAESSGTPEIVTLMSHAEIAMRVNLPGKFSFRMSWYQGIEGTTAWHAGLEASQPWVNSDPMEVEHTAWSITQAASAVDAAAIVGGTTNRTADVLKLPNGGYSYLGVCVDSCAVLQATLREEVTLFPCILAGTAKTKMSKMYSELIESNEKVGRMYAAKLAKQVRHALLQTPCDVVHEPATMQDAIRRVAACIPPVTPFATLERCREDLKVASAQLAGIDVHGGKSEQADLVNSCAAEVDQIPPDVPELPGMG